MNVCGTTRLLLPAFAVGLIIATATGHDGYGWIAAAVTAGITFVVQKVRGTSPSCALPLAGDADRTRPADQRERDQPASR